MLRWKYLPGVTRKRNDMDRKKLIIIGASGHGKVVADIALLNGYTDIVFLDDDETVKQCGGFPVVGKTAEARQMVDDKVVAIGNASIRERIQREIETVTLIHPDAVIGRNVKIGNGTVIMAGVIINSETKVGKGCILNTGSSVDHDCEISDFVHVAVGAHICGTVKVGKRTWVGAGATVSNNITICEDVMVGAGAVVIKDITEKGTYIGVPSRLMDKMNCDEENNMKNKVSGLFGGGVLLNS